MILVTDGRNPCIVMKCSDDLVAPTIHLLLSVFRNVIFLLGLDVLRLFSSSRRGTGSSSVVMFAKVP